MNRFIIVMREDYGTGKTARTHQESRMVVCCCCGRKMKVQKGKTPIKVINDQIAALVVKYVYCNYSLNNEAYPTAICTTCRLTLVATEKEITNYVCMLSYN